MELYTFRYARCFSAIIIAEILTSCIWCWNCTGLLGSFAVLNKICNNSFFQLSLFPSVLVEQCNNFWQKTKYKYTSSMNNTKQPFEFYTLSDGIRPLFLKHVSVLQTKICSFGIVSVSNISLSFVSWNSWITTSQNTRFASPLWPNLNKYMTLMVL